MIERNLKEIERYTKNKQFSSKCCLLCGKATTLYKIKEEYKDIAFILNKYKDVSKIKSFMFCSGCFHLTNNSKLMFGQFSRIYVRRNKCSILSTILYICLISACVIEQLYKFQFVEDKLTTNKNNFQI